MSCFRRGHGAIVAQTLSLSLAFQVQSLALAHPCHARFGAANASERPWRTAKPVPHPRE